MLWYTKFQIRIDLLIVLVNGSREVSVCVGTCQHVSSVMNRINDGIKLLYDKMNGFHYECFKYINTAYINGLDIPSSFCLDVSIVTNRISGLV